MKGDKFAIATLTLIGFAVMMLYAFVAFDGLGPSTPQFRIACLIVAIVANIGTAYGLLILAYMGRLIDPKPRARHIFHVYV